MDTISRRGFFQGMAGLLLTAMVPRTAAAQTIMSPGWNKDKEYVLLPQQVFQGEYIKKPGLYGMWCEVDPTMKIERIVTVHKPAGNAETIDPLDQWQTVGFKFNVAQR